VWLTGLCHVRIPRRTIRGDEVKQATSGSKTSTEINRLYQHFPAASFARWLRPCRRDQHAGIRQKVHSPAPINAAIGGFHLYNAKDEQLNWTADKMKEFQVAQILGALHRNRERLSPAATPRLSRHDCVVAPSRPSRSQDNPQVHRTVKREKYAYDELRAANKIFARPFVLAYALLCATQHLRPWTIRPLR